MIPLHREVRAIVGDAPILRPPARRADFMGMPAATFYTAEMVLALPPDGNRYETVRGELLVTPAPRKWHQEIVGRLYRRLSDYLDRHPFGHALLSPADISWGSDSLVQPDVFVVSPEQARTMEWRGMTDLLLIAEVLSPSSLRADRFTKRRLYQEVGVGTYWVIDPDVREVEVWTPDAVFPAAPAVSLHWHPAGAAVPFVLPLEELFRPI